MFEWLTSWFQSEPVSPELKKDIESTINSSKIVVYSKTYCPYCSSTKDLLSKYDKNFKLVELDTLSNGSTIQNALQEITGQRTVPNIFINGKHIGGNSDLQILNSQGKLQALLN
ncbi:Glutaredoxin-C6 [Candida viswanathii]|uniref:Glutaredoxin-C6 n=1 Tax=Candida viswanathii TaxID=5486 RepID=A0A367YIW4_9ASCO|nr:Glutaredoxin-C6 [Candida viswanathii]